MRKQSMEREAKRKRAAEVPGSRREPVRNQCIRCAEPPRTHKMPGCEHVVLCGTHGGTCFPEIVDKMSRQSLMKKKER